MTQAAAPESRDQSALATMRAFYARISRPRRRQLALVIATMLLSAVAEMVTIGAVLPFLALLADPARAAALPGYRLFLLAVGGESGDLMARATALLIVAVIVAAAVRLIVVRLTYRFAFALGHEIGTTIFARMLRQPYSLYVTRNPSTVVAGVDKVQLVIHVVLLPVLQGLTTSVIALAIIALLIAIAPATAALAAAAAALLYLAASYAVAARLRANGAAIANLASARAKAVQEGLGGLRDILIDHSQDIFEEKFRLLDRAYRNAQASLALVSASPRYVMEAAGIVLIGLLALHMSAQSGGIAAALPVLGALALGAQRLLPLLHTTYVGWTQFSGHGATVRDLLDLMEAETVATNRVLQPDPFCEAVVLDEVGLRHADGTWAVRGVSLTIAKGERIGLVGKTGSGKSSLIDLLMGLLDPAEGEVRIDGRRLDDETRPNWQAQIAHVAQTIYLADASIAGNIAFADADREIDMDRVREAARRAQIDTFIDGLPLGYESAVGDRGIRLSGGQRQRIAIARAFYKRASILILDEATGHLDEETEQAVMDALARVGRDITILIVAHRAAALAGCDRIVRLEAGTLIAPIAPAGRFRAGA